MTSYCAHYITGSLPFFQSYLSCRSSARIFVLREPNRFPPLDRSYRRRPDHSRCIDVAARRYPIPQGVTSNVQSNKTFPPEPLHNPPREGRHDLLCYVCPCFVLPFTSPFMQLS